MPGTKDLAHHQQDVASYLAWKIKKELARVVKEVDASHHSAEHVLFLVQEAMHRFRRLANDPEQLLKVECDMLAKRLRIAKQNTMLKTDDQETMPIARGRLFHHHTLEMERDTLMRKIKPSSRSISPETASTPSSDRSTASRRTRRQAGGFFLSKELENLLGDSSVNPHVYDYISGMSFAKNRRRRGKEMMEFPALHTALLFGTEQQARSWAGWLESNDNNVRLVDFFKRTVAHVAAEAGRVHLLTTILLAHKDSLDTRDALGLTPLMIAVLHGHLPCCKLLVNAGFDQKVRNSSQRNLLSIACKRRHFCIVEYLIDELGFLPNDDSGGRFCSPIHDAIESGDSQICEFLINSGADLHQVFENKTPRSLALEKGRASILQLINERILSSWNPTDPISVHLGFQNMPNLQYGAEDDINRSMSQPYDHPGQAYNTASHPF